jgi:hypothetical protein
MALIRDWQRVASSGDGTKLVAATQDGRFRLSPTGSRRSAPSHGWGAGMDWRASMIRAVNTRGMIVIAKGPHRGAALRLSARGKAGLRPRQRPADILQVDVRVAKLA